MVICPSLFHFLILITTTCQQNLLGGIQAWDKLNVGMRKLVTYRDIICMLVANKVTI